MQRTEAVTELSPDEQRTVEDSALELPRVLGELQARQVGPTLICLSGIHGNEPAGVHAARRVLAQLQERDGLRRGRLVCLAGNLAALHRGVRYQDRDLNRAWLAEDIEALGRRPAAEDSAEDAEQRQLLACFERERQQARGPLIFLDLHTSSAEGASFSCMSDTLANRRLALALPVPIILGLEECIDGAVMEYFNRHRCVAVAVEGGQHVSPQAVDNLEAAIWLALDRSGLLRAGLRDLDRDRQTLQRTRLGLPPVLEIRHRQAIRPGQEFVMEPGFRSFQPVEPGQHLATMDGVRLEAGEACRVLLPLYQGQGEDGYFLVRGVGMLWLLLASVLRRLRLHVFLPWMPGVRRHPEEPETLITDPRVSRWFRVQIFHLLGYRRRREVDGDICFSRRPDPALRR